MKSELITKAGKEVGPLVAEAFKEKAAEIAEYIAEKKFQKGKDVTVKLGSIQLVTVGDDLHVSFKGELTEKTDFSSTTTLVTLEPELFDKANGEKPADSH